MMAPINQAAHVLPFPSASRLMRAAWRRAYWRVWLERRGAA